MFSKQADEKVPVLCVVDNGHGMSYAEMMRMVSFGHKRPDEHCNDQIGTFGIGFKVNICHSNIAKYSLSYIVRSS
jgi:HSP90 family molecular chaperone